MAHGKDQAGCWLFGGVLCGLGQSAHPGGGSKKKGSLSDWELLCSQLMLVFLGDANVLLGI